jgi:drug/metabolite transporter (DMT)-like permease
MSDFRDTLRGILAMLACCLLFVCNDALVKYGSQTLPLGELLLVRSLIATTVVAVFAWWRGSLARARHCRRLPLVVRSVADGVSTVFYTIGLVHLPLADTSAICQATPLALTASGALVLGEKVGRRRWLSVFTGFLGMLIIVRPGGTDFDAWSLLIVLSVVMVVVRDTSTRFFAPGDDHVLMVLANLVAITLVAAGMALFEPWRPIDGRSLMVIVGASIFVIGGIVFSVEAMLHGDVSLVASFRYSNVLFAIVVGMLVWGDLPDVATLAGIVVVIGSGLYVFQDERRRVVAGRTSHGSV